MTTALDTQPRARDIGKRTTRPTEFAEKITSAPEATLDRPLVERYDSIEEKVKAMQAELATAVAGLADDENWQRHLDVMARFHSYSLSNQILIGIQLPEATRVAGFHTWKKLGRSVKKGERGISILAPRLVADRDDNGDPIYNEDGSPVKKIIGFTGATVFDVSQTEGEPLPETWQELSETPPPGFTDDLVRSIEAHGYKVEFKDLSRQSGRGYTTASGEKVVVIDSSTTPGTQATTLAHELGHILCGHTDADNFADYHTGPNGRRGDMEMEAESFAYVLARANGMQTHIQPASEYVAGWGTRAQEDLRATGETVQKAVKKALSSTPWVNVEA